MEKTQKLPSLKDSRLKIAKAAELIGLAVKDMLSGTTGQIAESIKKDTRVISDRMLKLEAAMENIPEIPTLADLVHHYEGSKAFYEGTEFWGQCLLFVPGVIAVQRVHMKKDYEVTRHIHAELECGIVEKGSFHVKVNGDEYIAGTGDVVSFPSNKPHSGTILEDCTVVFVTMPPAEGYPDGR